MGQELVDLVHDVVLGSRRSGEFVEGLLDLV